MLEKTLKSSLEWKGIQPVNPKRNPSWIFIGRTDAVVETPILWPPDTKNWLIGKDPDAGKDWRQEETTEDEIVGWHHWLDELPWRLRHSSVCLKCRRWGFDPWVGKISWIRKWQPAPVFLPGKSQGWRKLVGYSARGHKELDMTEWLHTHWLDGHHFDQTLELVMDREAWHAAVHVVTKSRTRLNNWTELNFVLGESS